MNRKERLARDTHFTTGAKVISVMFMVGVIALLAARAPLHWSESAALSTPPAVKRSSGQVLTFGSTLSSQDADTAARTAKQDDSPIPTF
jgi:hypothetical protein